MIPGKPDAQPNPPPQRDNASQVRHSRGFPVTERYLFAAILVGLCFLLISSGWMQRLDYLFYDFCLKVRPVSTSTTSVIVAIDEKSLLEYGRWPWSRDRHAALIKRLRNSGARAVAFDLLLSERSSPEADKDFAQAMAESGKVFLPLHIDHVGNTGHLTEILPIAQFIDTAEGLGHAQMELDADGIARGLYLYQGLGDSHWPSLALSVYQNLYPDEHQKKEELDNGGAFNVREQYRLIPFIGPPGSFPTLSYSEVMHGELPPDYFQNRVVFVGATAAGLGDFLPTPVSGASTSMAGVEVHANVFEGLVRKNMHRLISPTWQYLLSLSLVLIAALVYPRVSPEKNLPLTLALALSVLVFSYLLLRVDHQWYPPAAVVLSLIFAYPFWSWRRLSRLNQFLNQELKRLEEEPRLQQGGIYDSPQQWAQQVTRLLKPALWEFREIAPGGQKRIDLNADAGMMEILLPVSDAVGKMALYMRFEDHPDQLQQTADYLQRLYPRLMQKTTLRQPSSELIDRRISQVRFAIAAIRDMRKFVSETIANMPDGVLVGDEVGRILYLNEHASRWLSANATANAYIAECMPIANKFTPALWDSVVRKVLVAGEAQSMELHTRNTAVLISLAPMRFTHLNANGIIVNFSDITPIHEAQQKRLETIHFISHDLRAPLASQLALLDTLSAALPDAKLASKIDAARELTQKSLGMAEAFLQLARVEAADHIHFYDCELLDIVDNAVDSISPSALTRGIAVQVYCEEDSLPIKANADLLERALVNLLHNAVKFTPQNHSIELKLEKADAGTLIHLRDQGPGIAASEIPYLFERFRRTHASEQQGVQGSGLGLRFVKLVIDRHGGAIQVNSALGEGTEFVIELPDAE
ncbi:CHASE2 domain-containing protein [Hahella sp. NBU794]|uniref:CHASE2 domain-containing protein n=1 Tax=Hahella sp. NBU794 TaxID=3422590 RepID=UPI003D6DC104